MHLIRDKDEGTTYRIFCKLKKHLRGFFRKYGRGYVSYAGDYAINAIIVLIEKEEEPILTCSLITYLFSIAKNWFNKDLERINELYLNEGLVNKMAVVDNIYEEIEKNERKLLVNRCLKKVDKRCKQILDTICRSLNSKEAALELGFKSPEVYLVKKSECLEKFKKKLLRRRECKELFGNEEAYR